MFSQYWTGDYHGHALCTPMVFIFVHFGVCISSQWYRRRHQYNLPKTDSSPHHIRCASFLNMHAHTNTQRGYKRWFLGRIQIAINLIWSRAKGSTMYTQHIVTLEIIKTFIFTTIRCQIKDVQYSNWQTVCSSVSATDTNECRTPDICFISTNEICNHFIAQIS